MDALGQNNTSSLVKAIIKAGIIAGLLDITAATSHFLLLGNSDPRVIFLFIASGVFGKEAFEGGWPTVFMGFFFHMCIAMGWTVLYFLSYPYIKGSMQRWGIIRESVVYGIFVWFMMSMVVLPLSNVTPRTMATKSALIGAGILVICIGFPISYYARRYYSSRV